MQGMAYRIKNIAKIFWVNEQGVLEKQLDLAVRLGYLKLKYYSGIKDCKHLLYILVKLVVFIVRGDVTWREIII